MDLMTHSYADLLVKVHGSLYGTSFLTMVREASGPTTPCQTFIALSHGNNCFRVHTPSLRVLEDGEQCSSWFLQKPAVRDWLCSYLIAI